MRHINMTRYTLVLRKINMIDDENIRVDLADKLRSGDFNLVSDLAIKEIKKQEV